MKRKLFSRNFTLLVLGQISSLFGNYILRLALSMYVLEVTGSAAVFAGILSAATIPTILLSPLGGILADRADKRKVMVALDALTGTVVLCVAALLGEMPLPSSASYWWPCPCWALLRRLQCRPASPRCCPAMISSGGMRW